MKEYEFFVHIVVLVPKNNVGYSSVEISTVPAFFSTTWRFALIYIPSLDIADTRTVQVGNFFCR